ncbi:hypothetical protein CDL12_05637 [Handroanthus impetiginosus]|uniref:RNase H type-1 domain-containing protein n=1 Tax=Handroanthus impetiginosus TaxID=429701 RepID=A0A2G9HVX2_9LAMI|nr:hypothetical protein CDL12_05637 [Handroanthus impetiginosus]
MEPKTIMHCLFHCHVPRQVWALSNLPFSAVNRSISNGVSWFHVVRNEVSTDLFDFFLTVCWSLWFYRNNNLFGKDIATPLDIVSLARSFLSKFREATAATVSVPINCEVCSWETPERGWIKVNFDAAIFAKENKARISVITRDYRGTCIAWRTEVLDWVLNPKEAEARATLLACWLCRECSWSKVAIEGDCLAVI